MKQLLRALSLSLPPSLLHKRCARERKEVTGRIRRPPPLPSRDIDPDDWIARTRHEAELNALDSQPSRGDRWRAPLASPPTVVAYTPSGCGDGDADLPKPVRSALCFASFRPRGPGGATTASSKAVLCSHRTVEVSVVRVEDLRAMTAAAVVVAPRREDPIRCCSRRQVVTMARCSSLPIGIPLAAVCVVVLAASAVVCCGATTATPDCSAPRDLLSSTLGGGDHRWTEVLAASPTSSGEFVCRAPFLFAHVRLHRVGSWAVR